MTAMTAQTVHTGRGTVRLHLVPMVDVQAAREEFGAGLADAKAFVLETACTECGTEACATQPCTSCGAPCCSCTVDPHDEGLWFCEDCRPPACWCHYCEN